MCERANAGRTRITPAVEPVVPASFDVALSFAGEDRGYVDAVATRLRAMGFSVFYDSFERAANWGRSNRDVLWRVFRHDARFVVAFISVHYVVKPWTMFELRAALEGEASDGRPQVLPVRFDAADVPGMSSDKVWVVAAAWRPGMVSMPPDQIALHIRNRIGPQPHLLQATPIPPRASSVGDAGEIQRQSPSNSGLVLDLGRWSWVRNLGFGDVRYPYGKVLHNAYPGYEMENVVEYEIEMSAPGEYVLVAEYAARICRPVRMLMNDMLVNGSGLELTTGGWEEPFQESYEQARVYLSEGRYSLRLERDSFFPHVRGLKLDRVHSASASPIQSERPPAALDGSSTRVHAVPGDA